MNENCPLCGRDRDSKDWEREISGDPVEIKNEILNLDRALEDLTSGQE